MIQYKVIGVEVNLGARGKAEADPQAPLGTASIAERVIIKAIVLLLAKSAKSMGRTIISKLYASLVQTNVILVNIDPKENGKKKFHEVNEQNDAVMDDFAKQVQSLFYNDMHFNAVNARMHTTLKCETPDGWSSDQIFKMDTGADGNLMPISMFARLFPHVSLDALSRMVEKDVTLYAYNNTPIKQFGTCRVRLSFKGRSYVCKCFVVEHETAIVGISDSEKLRLVQVNFDMLRTNMSRS